MNILRAISGIIMCAVITCATSFCAMESTGLLPKTGCCSSSHQKHQTHEEQESHHEHSESLCCELAEVRFYPVKEQTQLLVSVLTADLPSIPTAFIRLELDRQEFRKPQSLWPPIDNTKSLQAFLKHSRSPRAPALLA
jgi:hypothetical protein